MPHHLETMAYVGATPWHGLGHQLTAGQPIDVWAQQAGMDWHIREAPVRFMTESAGGHHAILSFPENKVLFRSDTLAPLSVVSNRYQVVQPKAILEFYRDLTELFGFTLETGGVIKGGKKLWSLAKTNQSARLKGDDVIKGYLLLATACDGTLATTAQFTSIRVVCNNTLAVALSNGSDAVKVPHSTVFNADAVKNQLGLSVPAWDNFIGRMKMLAERKVKSQEAMHYFLRVFAAPGKTAAGLGNERAVNKGLALYEGAGKGSDRASSKGTAFGLLNAVTEYVDFARQARSVDNRLDSAWFGAGAALKQKALEQALLMIA